MWLFICKSRGLFDYYSILLYLGLHCIDILAALISHITSAANWGRWVTLTHVLWNPDIAKTKRHTHARTPTLWAHAAVIIFGYFGWLPLMWASSPRMLPHLPAACQLQKRSWPHFLVLPLSLTYRRWSDTRGAPSSRLQQHILFPSPFALRLAVR